MAADPSSPLPGRAAASSWRLALLALPLLAAGCAGDDTASFGAERVAAPFRPAANLVTTNSLTAQRVRGTNPEIAPLLPEPGNVWPAAEAPRPTLLGNPEEAMRNIPDYRPSLIDGAPPASSPVPTSGDQRPPRRSSSTAVPPLTAPGEGPRFPPLAEPAQPVTPSPRREGQPLVSPQGRPAIGTGGTDRVQGFTSPQGGGVIHRDGNVETWVGPDGRTTTRVVPQ